MADRPLARKFPDSGGYTAICGGGEADFSLCGLLPLPYTFRAIF